MQCTKSLFLLYVLCCLLGVSSQLVVTQSEDVTIEEGHTAEISCCWTDRHETVRVTWKKNEKIVIPEKLEKKSCSLKLANITKADEGTYFCMVAVEVPILMKVSGNGTVLTVKSKEKTTKQKDKGQLENSEDGSPSHFVFTQSLRCLPVVTLLIISAYIYNTLVKKTKQKDTPSPQTQGQNDIELQNV